MKLFSANSTHTTPNSSYIEPAAAADPYAENISKKIAAWQRHLIDLSPRNRMLNYCESKGFTLQILAPAFSELFQRLVLNEESLIFQHMLDTAAKGQPPATAYAGEIKTPEAPFECRETLQNLQAKAKLARDEQGLNVLYLCFGFLAWNAKSANENPTQKAPLILVPVELRQQAFNAPYILAKQEDEPAVNQTLQYKIAQEYGLILPEFDPHQPDLEAFLNNLQSLVEMHGWKIHREVSLGLLSDAKMSMHQDLARHRDRIVANPFIRAMCGDTSALKIVPSQYHNFDFDSIPPHERWQTLNADAGQQEAITLAKAGISFVLQGAPGTGKSQTIANIITEALSQGQKVLFVSQKAAALQVVYQRLAANGLGDFCLPLHNHKLNKREIRDLIAANLQLPQQKVNPEVLNELNQLFEYRNELNRYARELHKEIAPLNLSIYSAYGFLAKHATTPVIPFVVDDPAAITNEFFHTMLYSVADLAESIKKLNGPTAANPWFNTKLTAVDQVLRNQITAATSGLDAKLLIIDEILQEADRQFDLPPTSQSWAGAQDLAELLAALQLTGPFPSAWLENEAREKLRQSAENNQNARLDYMFEHQKVLDDFQPAILDFDLEAWLATLRQTLDHIKAMPVDLGPDQALELKTALHIDAKAKELLHYLEETYADYLMVTTSLNLTHGDRFADILKLCDVIKAMVGAPPLQRAWFSEDLSQRLALLHKALEHRQNVAELTQKLLTQWEKEILDFNYGPMLRRFKTEYSGMFKKLNKQYRDDLKTIREMLRTVADKLTDEMVIELLLTLRNLEEEKKRLKIALNELTVAFNEQPWENQPEKILESLNAGLQAVKKLQAIYHGPVPPTIIRMVCEKQDFAPTYTKLQQLTQTLSVESLTKAQDRVANLLDASSAGSDLHGTIFPRLKQLLQHTGRLELLLNAVNVSAKRQISAVEVEALVSQALTVKQKRAEIAASDDGLYAAFETLYQGPDTDWDVVIAALERIDELAALMENQRYEKAFVQNLCHNAEKRQAINDLTQRLQAALEAARPAFTVFKGLFHNGSLMEASELAGLVQKFRHCLNGFELLDDLLAYKDAQNACIQKGLGEFVLAVDAPDKTLDIYAAFQKGFYIQWLNAVLENRSAIFNFKRNLHDDCAQKFCHIDEKQLEVAQYRIREKVTGALPFREGFVTANDETRILKRELDKQQGLLPVKELLNAIPNLLLQVKPCLMLSPLAVADFLTAETYKFDLVIFDEASQIFPHDAISSIHRGQQVIIVGDSQQLPPANFLNNTLYNDCVEEDGQAKTIKSSILETAARFLPQRTLNWHYRSRHEHLIAFANHEIYRDKLTSFPAPFAEGANNGVELVHVAGGIYQRDGLCCNFDEAQKCVELLKQHIEQYPDRSLGIIALGEKQQHAIMQATYKFRADNPEFENFFTKDREEAFFIKNLANVQGDERDTIFISIGYGKDLQGKMELHFDPLNRTDGERRLNTAITRARCNVKLVSSILPQEINLEQTDAPGVLLLRGYLDFALRGPTALKAPIQLTYNAPTDDFVAAVSEFLRTRGYKVRTHWGYSAYKIDIAVEHPQDPTRFVAGIECDGLAYIAAKTARDRDHLRRTVLSNLGWRLYRVWSAAWFANFDVESARLLNFINSQADFSTSPASAVVQTDKSFVAEFNPESTEIANELPQAAAITAAETLDAEITPNPDRDTVDDTAAALSPDTVAEELEIQALETDNATQTAASNTDIPLSAEANPTPAPATTKDDASAEVTSLETPTKDSAKSSAPADVLATELADADIQTEIETREDLSTTTAITSPIAINAETSVDDRPPGSDTNAETAAEIIEMTQLVEENQPEIIDFGRPTLPINILPNTASLLKETETEVAIAALTDRRPGEELPEPTLTKTLAATPAPVLTRDGDLAEIPADYAKFLENQGVAIEGSKHKIIPALSVTEQELPAKILVTAAAPPALPVPEETAAPDIVKPSTAVAPSPDVDNPFGFEYYKEADWSKAQLSPHSDKLTHLGEQILYVVRIEQPIHQEILNRRLVGVFNNQKVTSLVRSSVAKALQTKIAEKIEIDADGFITLLHFNTTQARRPLTSLERRAPEHISPQELAAAIGVILQTTQDMKHTELIAQTAAAFGYNRRNNKMNHYIESLLKRMQAEGKIKITDHNKVSLFKA